MAFYERIERSEVEWKGEERKPQGRDISETESRESAAVVAVANGVGSGGDGDSHLIAKIWWQDDSV